MKKFIAVSLLDVVFMMLINIKMPTIVNNMNRIISCSAELSIEKFISLGPDLKVYHAHLNSV